MPAKASSTEFRSSSQRQPGPRGPDLASHQLTWKCKKALSKRKVVFLQGSVHKFMLAGGVVAFWLDKKWAESSSKLQCHRKVVKHIQRPRGSLILLRGPTRPPSDPEMFGGEKTWDFLQGCTGRFLLGEPLDGSVCFLGVAFLGLVQRETKRETTTWVPPF